MNVEEIETVLREGSQQVADATPMTSPEIVRARGNRRRRTMAAGAAVLGLAVIAGTAATAVTITGRHATVPNLPAVGGDSLSAQLTVPAVYAYDVPNRVGVTISNKAKARTVLVTVGLGRQHLSPSQGDMLATVEVRGAGGKWQFLHVRHHASGWSASYQLRLATGTTSQHFRIVPPWTGNHPPTATQPLAVSLSAGDQVLLEQRTPAAPVRFVSATLTAKPVPGSTIRPITINVHNPTSTEITPLVLMLNTVICNSQGTACGEDHPFPAPDQVQWWTGSVWKPLPAAKYGIQVTTWRLGAGASNSIRLRVVTSGSSSHQKTGQLQLFVEVQNPLAFVELQSAAFPLG